MDPPNAALSTPQNPYWNSKITTIKLLTPTMESSLEQALGENLRNQETWKLNLIYTQMSMMQVKIKEHFYSN